MDKMKAITFFDLDGTLLDGKSQITPKITAAVAALKDNQILPLIATGRTLCEIQPIMKASGIDSAIVMNGKFIHYEGKTIYSDEFTTEECVSLHEHVKQRGHELAFYNERRIFCTGHTGTVKQAYDYIHSAVPEIDPTGYENDAVNMMLVLSQHGDDDEYYYERFPELTFYRNGPFSIDIVRKGVSKGSGVKNLFNTLGLNGIPTYAFGDGINDLALFEACDYGIAMGNAREELKEKATFISTKNTENGIVNGLKKFDLL